ncbi:MAG: hypothetical protein AT715_00875 [Thermoproteus sp. JCHS_4]|jgi:hypothetical protein|nr:MAG: hypothetical protein AT715_00875 [Thermoproteus sp. JCHS_4]
MLCISLDACLSEHRPDSVDVATRMLGGLGLRELASRVKSLRVITQGPILGKLRVLETVDNNDVEVRYVPKLFSSFYVLRKGDRACAAFGGDLFLDAVEGSASGLLLANCGDDAVGAAELFEKLWSRSRNILDVDPYLLGRTKDWGAYRVIAELRRVEVRGEDEEDLVDKIVRGYARRIFGIDDSDEVARRFWSAIFATRDMSVKVMGDPSTGLPVTAPLIYYSVKVLRSPPDRCQDGPCLRTTAKLLERALRHAPQSKLHSAWREALRNGAKRREIERSPYLPALLLLTGKVEIGYDKSIDARIYRLRR